MNNKRLNREKKGLIKGSKRRTILKGKKYNVYYKNVNKKVRGFYRKKGRRIQYYLKGGVK